MENNTSHWNPFESAKMWSKVWLQFTLYDAYVYILWWKWNGIWRQRVMVDRVCVCGRERGGVGKIQWKRNNQNKTHGMKSYAKQQGGNHEVEYYFAFLRFLQFTGVSEQEGNREKQQQYIVWVMQYDADDDETRKHIHIQTTVVSLIRDLSSCSMFIRPKVPND